jgi:hypothetical protein
MVKVAVVADPWLSVTGKVNISVTVSPTSNASALFAT